MSHLDGADIITINSERDEENQILYNNNVLRKLDGLPFGKWHFFVMLALGLVWIFDGYEVTLISLYRNQIEAQYD